MIGFIFIIVAGLFNSVMDTLMFHYGNSLFKNLNKAWWNPNYSWMSVKPFLGIVRLDAWHLFKYGMLFSWCLAVLTYTTVFGFLIDGIIMTLCWWLGFEIGWRILRKK